MNLERVSITTGVKRSDNFQSVDCSMTVEFTLSPGEDRQETCTKAHRWLLAQVNQQASEALITVLHTQTLERDAVRANRQKVVSPPALRMVQDTPQGSPVLR
jgi:hypothetical protein